MSDGFAPIPLLKAAPEPDQVAERLEGGPYAGMELCLLPRHVADDAALERAIAAVRDATAGAGLALTAEAPVAWPSGAFVRVDRLDDEARAGIERSAAFAAAIGSEVLTIHLFVPQSPAEYATGGAVDDAAVARFLACYAEACADRGVVPLIENVPPVLRMRTGGVFLSPIGGHWRDLLTWRERVGGLGFTFDTSHAALFRSFAAAYPSLYGLASAAELELERYVEELGPACEVAHVSNAAGVLGEGLPYHEGELDLDPVVARLAALVRFVVAEINEPDQRRSPAMKAGYRAVERAMGTPIRQPWRTPRRLAPDDFDWQAVVGRRDPVPDVLALAERFEGKRILVTGGSGSIGRALTRLLAAVRPQLITVVDNHEAALTADRRDLGPRSRRMYEHVLCDVRDGGRLDAELTRAAPDAVFHLAAYKHVDWAERYPEEFAATNLQGSWNVLQAADRAGAETVIVASTDKAARASSLYGRSKRLMEALARLSAERSGAPRAAVRLVNVLGSAGSASELFLRQARADVPLTVTDGGMLRYWITTAHAAALIAHAGLVADEHRLLTAAGATVLTVGELAERIWRSAGRQGDVDIDVIGVRAGETMDEVLVGLGEELGEEGPAGAAPISGGSPPDVGALADAVASARDPGERRRRWLDGLLQLQMPGAVGA